VSDRAGWLPTEAELLQAAGHLTARQRQVVYLISVRRLTTRQAAAAIGVSQPRVMRILTQARAALAARIFDAAGIDPCALGVDGLS
jgi:DNA-directed RNA polymerase specialized sigma24 family protein